MRITSYLSALLAFTTTGVVGKNVIGYYPSWKKHHADAMDLRLYTHINFAFAIPARDGGLFFEGDWFLLQVVSSLHSKGVKAMLSVGGWTGSKHFSPILKDAAASASLIRNIVRYMQRYDLDGVDLDWEYPGRLGNSCNAFDAEADARNYLAFLRALRQQMEVAFGPGRKLLTLALRVEPFDGPDGRPLADVAAFAAVADFGSLMQFDVNGGWNRTTGPLAPLRCERGKGLQVSFVSAIDAWVRAGWPANKLNAGYAFYGRSTTALADMMLDPTNQYQPQAKTVPLGDSEDAPWHDACAGTTANSGIWQWKHMMKQGVLSSPTKAKEPWVRQWDNTSQTPWVFNPETRVFISYDDPQSLQVKVDYAASRGLAGAMVWSLNMDAPSNTLLNVLRGS
ncbi:chitinase [Cordyceps militaris CM01]|uniref:chitinase n=1 Tax=Cordyceps militaris (strain CM01) TaxID=983644 RepID=G3JTI8_CORMM|nr:chitinase [Cordyceps militaris CM01]EGX87992.1 chitinase [Cordyceps militaris CM01]